MPIGTGIDIGSYSLKIVQITRPVRKPFQKARTFITGLARITLFSPNQEVNQAGKVAEIQELLRRILHPLNIKPKNCVYGVTGRDINLRISLVPPISSPFRLKNMMKYEIEQIVGKSGGDVYSDYYRINLPDKQYPEFPYLIGLAKASFIDQKIELLLKAEIIPIEVIPQPIALFKALMFSSKINPDKYQGTILLMDIGLENINLIIQKNGSLLFARNLLGGGATFTQAIRERLNINTLQAEILKIKEGNLARIKTNEEDELQKEAPLEAALLSAAGQIHSVIETSLSFARTLLKKKDLEIDRIFLSGGGAKLRGLPAYLTLVTGRSVEIFDPLREIGLERLPTEHREKLSATDSGTSDLTIALGLALMGLAPEEKFISFTPSWIKQRHNFYRRTIPYAISVLLIIITLIGLLISSLSARKKVATELDRLLQQQKTMDQISKKFNEEFILKEAVQAEYQSYVTELKKRAFLADAFWAVRQLFPSNAWLANMTLGKVTSKESRGVYEDNVIVLAGYLGSDDEQSFEQFRNFVAELNNPVKTGGKIIAELEKLDRLPEPTRKGKVYFEILIKPKIN